MRIVLEGVVGSTAHGLSTETSDIDTAGVFVLPSSAFSSLYPPQDKSLTKTSNDPDRTLHEVGKFFRLAIKGSPTILEVLYLHDYTKLDECGEMIVNGRSLFLSRGIVSQHIGYANNELNQYIESLGRGRPKGKRVRHAFRLLEQAISLAKIGHFDIRVKDREWYFELEKLDVPELTSRFAEKLSELRSIEANLPESVQHEAIESLLRLVRECVDGNIDS